MLDGNEIYGATGVDVNGLLYDVEIIDSSCAALYSGCDETSDFLFTNVADATAAAQALLDQVLNDVFGSPSQQFDTDPELTRGCSNSGLCRILTPYGILDSEGNIIGATADNHSINENDTVTPNVGISALTDLSVSPYTLATYAVWTPYAVPIPSSALLFFSSLLAFISLKRKTANH